MLNIVRDAIHQSNVDAGWWSDLETGECILATRNRPELLCLVTSELCEAVIDGYSPDSHLPQFPAAHVEAADAAIRIYDLAGADKIDLTKGDKYRIIFTTELDRDMMQIAMLISSYALEGVRKGNDELYHQSVADALAALYRFADIYQFDLDECIQAKVAYNQQRADHKIENRKADGGKKI